ncbi:hypothetical protein APR12_003414 [Nocardia amikacinitolerans]|uniref:hypothetical protein n=1 Tax=Nocardia amikacinitolerans TaxID=756689 RepID=UPI0008376105|nr:hypothetical protein [Nocardia amikacinitolerans]MCP2318061.1 hypothetical protein [Nocardia amikacinitolerans]
MTFMLPLEAIGAEEQQMRRFAERGARASGTPFVSFFRPDEVVALAEESGFAVAEHISHEELIRRYFADHTDGLRPAESEQMLVVRT